MTKPKKRTQTSGRSARKSAASRSSRGGSGRKPAGRKKKVEQRTLRAEAAAAFSIVGSLILFAGFVSHLLETGVLPLGEPGAIEVFNVSGPLVHVAMTLLYGLLGWCALAPSIWLAWLGHFFWHQHESYRDFEHNFFLRTIVGFGGMLSFACALLAVAFGSAAGGTIGEWLAAPTQSLLGGFGAGMVFLALLLLSIAIATGRSIGRVISGFFGFCLSSLKFFFWQLPVLVWQLLYTVYDYALEGWYIFLDWVEELAIGERLADFADMLMSPFRREEEDYDDEDDEEEQEIARRKVRPRAVKPHRKKLKDSAKDEVKVERHMVSSKATKGDLQRVKKRIIENNKQIAEREAYAAFKDYTPPPLSLLTPGKDDVGGEDNNVLKEKSAVIVSKLKDFKIEGRVTSVHPGPVITLFEFEPAPGVKVRRIENLADDLAMSLRASSIRIIAPIPGKGAVGIEVPNNVRETVRLRDLLESKAFVGDDSLLTIPIGKDTYGNPTVADVAKMPHLLIAGATGTGKSVCINSFLTSLLYRASPAELGLILIDPKILELSVYEGVPHLRVPVVTEKKKVKGVLLWAVNEMEKRYRLMQKFGTRSVEAYNQVVLGQATPEEADTYHEPGSETSEGASAQDEEDLAADSQEQEKQEPLVVEKLVPLPKIVIVIDELADLIMVTGREVEDLITRLAQKARAAGIHLIIATQRPSSKVITGLIKANIPARISFRVSSMMDSRVVLDANGAERLLGNGDMLFLRPGAMALTRLHGAFVSDGEVKRVVDSLKKKWKPKYNEEIIEMCEKVAQEEEGGDFSSGGADEYDEHYDKAIQLILEKGKASTSMIQRAFKIGYNRAARILDMMEQEGVVGPAEGSKPREILLQRGIDGE